MAGTGLPLTSLGDHLGPVRPRQAVPFAAGFDHADQQGQGAASLLRPGAVRDAPEDDPVAQGAFGFVVGQRQIRVGQDDPDRIPVVEELARQGAGLLLPGIPMPFADKAKLFQPVLVASGQRGRRALPRLADGLHQFRQQAVAGRRRAALRRSGFP